jgi:hypothetical protein
MLAATLVCAAASAAGFARAARPPDSGVRGIVVLGLRCPINLERDRCNAGPKAVVVVVRRAADHGWVASIATDERGRFRRALAPGAYVLRVRPARRATPPREARARVLPHRFVTVVIR